MILVVEDSEECAAMLELALAMLPGVEVLVVGAAEDAVRIVGSRHIAALITDVQLPGMDGFELVSRLRSDARHANLPILVLSANLDRATPQRALDAGANAFMAKPFSPAAVRQAVERLIDAH